MSKETRKISNSEIVWIVFASLFVLASLFFGIIGLIARYLESGNWIEKFNDSYNAAFKMSLPFTGHATLYLVIGAAIYLISTLIYAKRSESKFEKQERRKARRRMEEDIVEEQAAKLAAEAREEEDVIDAEPIDLTDLK